MLKKYVVHLARILEGAMDSDLEKVMGYASKLSEALDADGEKDSAERIRQVVQKRRSRMFGVARAQRSAPPEVS